MQPYGTFVEDKKLANSCEGYSMLPTRRAQNTRIAVAIGNKPAYKPIIRAFVSDRIV